MAQMLDNKDPDESVDGSYIFYFIRKLTALLPVVSFFIANFYLMPNCCFCAGDKGSIKPALRKSLKDGAISHKRAVLSSEPVRIVLPSGEKATERIAPE